MAIRDSLVLTDDQRALRDTVRGFLAGQLASDALRAMIDAEPGYSPELHARLATGLGLAVAHGRTSLAVAELADVELPLVALAAATADGLELICAW